METPSDLARLALAHGVATEYVDDRGTQHVAPPEVLEAVLAALDVDTRDPALALSMHHVAAWTRLVSPVTVAWEGKGPLRVRALVRALPASAHIEIRTEAGERIEVDMPLAIEGGATAELDGRHYVEVEAMLPLLSLGYHDLTIELAGVVERSRVIAAPRRGHRDVSRGWGVFAPLFGLRSAASRGIGDLGDLRRLIDFTRSRGGSTVATLPLLAAFLDEPFEPSPYAPVSRLAWNELYLELERAPGWAESVEARDALSAPPAARALADELRAPLVDYGRVAALRRPAIEALAGHAFASPSLRSELAQFARAHPVHLDYARFRSMVARTMDDGRVRVPAGSASVSEDIAALDQVGRYHLYAQFALDRQLTELASVARAAGATLYLDLPVGVHADGFDTWRYRDQFVMALDAGAPPDRAFPGGQNWGFPPLHPEGSRAHGHEYFAASIRNHLRFADRLRIDHVMALHRLFVIPGGVTEGTYLQMPSEELWAVLALESQRARSAVVGEDLGTVPPEVREAMRDHGVGGIYVLEYEVSPVEPSLPPTQPEAVASIATHDMPPLAAWLTGADIDARERLGQSGATDPVTARGERERQVEALALAIDAEGSGAREMLERCLAVLGESEAGLVLVSLDDLLGETESLNIPGTRDEHPNWRRRLDVTLEELADDPHASALLALLDRHRARP